MIYLILNEKRSICKIGFTSDIKRRMSSMKNMATDQLSLVSSIEGDFKTEKDIHLKFRSKRGALYNQGTDEACFKLVKELGLMHPDADPLPLIEKAMAINSIILTNRI